MTLTLDLIADVLPAAVDLRRVQGICVLICRSCGVALALANEGDALPGDRFDHILDHVAACRNVVGTAVSARGRRRSKGRA